MQCNFIFKEGRGNASNSCRWKVCHDTTNNIYTAEISFGGVGGSSYQLFQITKTIFDEVGTFEDDDYKSERLIGSGRELFRYDSGRCAPAYYVIFDTSYATLCPWIDEYYKDKSKMDCEIRKQVRGY